MKSNKFSIVYLPFAATVFLGAFLLFQVQPMIGKYILPWFGGSSFVWITSLLFFQVILLLGYAYSYILTKLRLWLQIGIHVLVLLGCASLIVFLFFHFPSPVMPPIDWKLSDTFSPLLQVLGILFISIALPFFVLSTTSTLLQKWFSYLWQDKSPYALYSLSNLGSFIGILSYPFLIEPLLPLRFQGVFWSLFFLCYILFFCFSSFQTFHFIHKKKKESEAIAERGAATHSPKWKHMLLWIFLPFLSSLLLSAMSYHITQSVAPIPFLWLVPLGLYLLSFVMCFTERNLYYRKFYPQLSLLLIPTIVLSLFQTPLLLFLGLLIYSMFLFCAFMVCHGELYRLRPSARNLNLYYLLIAFGSTLGSGFVAIISPLVFKGVLGELYIGLFILTIICTLVALSYDDSIVTTIFKRFFKKQKTMITFASMFIVFLFTGLAVISYFYNKNAYVQVWRNFYGTLRLSVKEVGGEKIMCIVNGKIIHGCQYLAPKKSKIPGSYYGKNSGAALALQSMRTFQEQTGNNGIRMGVIGLGAGSLAVYGEKGDFFRFYELNPDDVIIADKHFTYLKESQAEISVVTGDGRLALEKDVQTPSFGKYDVLVLDAFTDDGIPVHLLTKEAFEIYLQSLSSDGIIAVHISNSYLDLSPVLKKVAKVFELESVFVHASPINKGYAPSEWVLLSRKKNLLPSGKIDKVKFTPNEKVRDSRLWTDNYSNLFQVVRHLPVNL